ncbi:MAG TPA: hypothetical protein VN176_14270 [Verrucomicrobiae bacterium]|jgi:hypothetical protein|nr:hypothetical protein [Verrucomicrobiae bacterium]
MNLEEGTATAQEDFVTRVLEHDQLSQGKKRPVPRRHLRGIELLVLWSLRIYVLFMIAVVVYQVMQSMR